MTSHQLLTDPGPLLVVYRNPADLRLDRRNPRRHEIKQIKQLADCIQVVGFIVPVLVDTDGQLIVGHGRVLAARRLGMITIPTICIPPSDP